MGLQEAERGESSRVEERKGESICLDDERPVGGEKVSTGEREREEKGEGWDALSASARILDIRVCSHEEKGREASARFKKTHRRGERERNALLNTNLACNASSCQSISLPIILNNAFESITTLTPSCSTTSSNLSGLSTYSRW